MKKLPKFLKHIIMTLIIMITVTVASYIIRFPLDIHGILPLLYIFGVFLVAIATDGFLYSSISALISALVVCLMFDTSGNPLDFDYSDITATVIIFSVAAVTSLATYFIKRDKALTRISGEEHLKANLMRAISHDLRTPLTSIYGSSSAILDNYDTLSRESKLELAEKIKEESKGLIRMVENLLLITRISNNDVSVEKSPYALEELVDAVAVKFKKHFPEVELQVEIPDDFITVLMDPMLIVQVINNLLENAVFHAHGMTMLKLRASIRGKYVYFEIIDDGCGIPKENLDRIFNGYISSVNENRHTNRHNLGIGLSVCDAIIKAHGSRIYAINNEFGGASFCFKLEMENNDE